MSIYLATRAVWALLVLMVLNCNLVENKGIRITKGTSAMQSSQQDHILEEPLLQFGGELFKLAKSDNENIIFSPLSVHGALNMVLLGTKNHGEAEKELIKVLGYSHLNQTVQMVHEGYAQVIDQFKEMDKGRKEYQLLEANNRQWSKPPPVLDMWMTALSKGPYKLLPEYMTQLQTFYRSQAHQVQETKNSPENQKIVDAINSWAKEAGFKNGVLSMKELEEEFSVMLISAVRVESHWLEEFYEHEVEEAFYNYGKKDQLVKNVKILGSSDIHGNLVQFSRMGQRTLHSNRSREKYPELYDELAGLEFRAVEIPLTGNVSLLMLEPFDSVEGKGLAALEKALLTTDANQNQSKLKKVFQILDSAGREARVEFDSIEMPQFNFETDLKLKEHLQSMGLKRMFSPGQSEITKMSEGEHYISDARHQAVVEVNKDGLKAAGITFMRAIPMSAKVVPHPIHIQIKNPYMFIIRYNKLPLFMGHLVHL